MVIDDLMGNGLVKKKIESLEEMKGSTV